MDRLESEISQLLADERVMMLDISAVTRKGRLNIRVIGDRKTGGFTIDDCAKLSREIRHLILEKKLYDGDFAIEISSPGLDYPLREPWQFEKNIGRLLKVSVPGEKGPRELSGRLTAVSANGIMLSVDNKEISPQFSDVLSAKVLPEFKPPRTESKR